MIIFMLLAFAALVICSLNELVSEISCFMYLPVAGLLVTGLEDGSVKWWNPDSGRCGRILCILCVFACVNGGLLFSSLKYMSQYGYFA